MTYMKRLLVIAIVAATSLLSLAAIGPAHASTTATSSTPAITTAASTLDPIGEWIVLANLFGGGSSSAFGTRSNIGNIGEWIVLNGLFGGGTSSGSGY